MTWNKKISLKKISAIVCIVLATAGLLLIANKLIHYYSVRFFNVPEKYWYHGVNSPEILMEAGKFYAGLELDLIYHEQEKAYENSHDPVSLEKHNLSKTLDAYILLGRKNKLWLDFKNLTEEP